MEKDEQSENSLRTVALVLLCCGAVKMLHLLGVISVEGECARSFLSAGMCSFRSPARESQRQSVLQGGCSEQNSEGPLAAEVLCGSNSCH